ALSGAWFGGGAVVAHSPGWTAGPGSGVDPFDLLDEAGLDGTPRGDEMGAGPVGGGIVGFLGYQAGALVERLPAPPPRAHPMPAWHLAHYDHVLHLDREGQWWFEALAGHRSDAWVERRAAELDRRLAGAPPRPTEVGTTPFAATPTGSDHR